MWEAAQTELETLRQHVAKSSATHTTNMHEMEAKIISNEAKFNKQTQKMQKSMSQMSIVLNALTGGVGGKRGSSGMLLHAVDELRSSLNQLATTVSIQIQFVAPVLGFFSKHGDAGL